MSVSNGDEYFGLSKWQIFFSSLGWFCISAEKLMCKNWVFFSSSLFGLKKFIEVCVLFYAFVVVNELKLNVYQIEICSWNEFDKKDYEREEEAK